MSTMSNYKTVPNQKVVCVCKAKADKDNYYATINLNALFTASKDLQAGAFKLWIYFAKNQNNFTFALSSKEVEENFGIKIKQYNNAVEELLNKGYLVCEKGNMYKFYEIAQKGNSVITKEDNEVITKCNNELLPKETRNITNNTIYTTKQNEFIF